MLDPKNNLILLNGRDKTAEIDSCQYHDDTGKYTVTFKNSTKNYTYGTPKILWLQNPRELDPKRHLLSRGNKIYSDVRTLLEFSGPSETFYRIEFNNGTTFLADADSLSVEPSCVTDIKSATILEYLNEIAEAGELTTSDGTKILPLQYRSLGVLSNGLASATYLLPQTCLPGKQACPKLIYPFGCNRSQLEAVRKAFSSQLSVIQGPPGTGKTQTILNILANILMMGKTAIVVSNNNLATENIHEKLIAHGLGFTVAPLGCDANKRKFSDSLTAGREYPPDIDDWSDPDTNTEEYSDSIDSIAARLEEIFIRQECLALCKRQLAAFRLEHEHFLKGFDISVAHTDSEADSRNVLQLLLEMETDIDASDSFLRRLRRWLRQLRHRYIHHIPDDCLSPISPDTLKRIRSLFYTRKSAELSAEAASLEEYLRDADIAAMMQKLNDMSSRKLRNHLSRKYGHGHRPPTIDEHTLKHSAADVLNEYPIVMSTTFSARSSLKNTVYDYVIMDEASQIAVETGFLALSCARNAVIVGDPRQLPNVIKPAQRHRLKAIFNRYDIPEGYDCSRFSFLDSIVRTIPDLPQTLLREHYRCPPRIIDFCNQKFYGGRLIIMTDDEGDTEAVSAIRTVKGNHARDHVNRREIEVIGKEVLPNLNYRKDEIGIITPYNNQVDAIASSLGPDTDVATIHKFQGREKDAIIMSVVDNRISRFVDDPNMLNVAVSRAKKKFCLVVTGNREEETGNISDLLDYISYTGRQIAESHIHSVFDLLYKEYEAERKAYLKGRRKISAYDSENLIIALLEDIINEDPKLSHLDFHHEYQLSLLLRDKSRLSEEERRYVANSRTHVDLLIFSRVSKKAVMAIEVDGYSFHRDESPQHLRDRMKDDILSRYGIRLLRLRTDGSGEKETITGNLYDILNLNDDDGDDSD